MNSPSTPSAGQALPTGTVTFLFTDIEGSTKLAQEHPDKWESLRARHHAILQSAMDAHDGYVFQVIGDAFCVAFHTANDALRAAVKSQTDLQNEDWGDTPVKVRMGIHTGKAEIQESGEYHGFLAMSRIQRLMSAGHGGQALISAAAEELLLDDLPDDISLRDLGEHRLKDLIRPEHIYQLVIPYLPLDFPPIKTLDVYRHNLPTQMTSFIGREKEMSEIKQSILAHRLITLTGSGGTGKTRLSLQVAADLLDQFPEGVWFVELAALSDPDLIPQTILFALGVREQEGKTALQSLTDYVHEKNLLIVLDNCEHLIETCARLTEPLLGNSPALKILASSREALGVKGEMAWHVPSLSLPNIKDLPDIEQLSQYEAVRLFIERATLAQSHYQLTKENAPATAQICFRLDGIPLAIELAAARVKMLTVEQIAKRLDDRFRLLTGGARTALPRQQTLRATIDWSYNLLSEQEKTLFRRLAVFVGGWTLEAAEAVCGGEGIEAEQILDLMSQFVNKSLVTVEIVGEESRYHRLETIRQYAREKLLETDEVARMRDKHLDFFLAFALEAELGVHAPDPTLWPQRLDTEYDNLRSALDWATESGRAESGLRLGSALHYYWLSRGYWSEGRERLARLLARPEAAGHTPARAAALNLAGDLAIQQSDLNAGWALLDESKAIGLELGAAGKPYLGWSLTLIGHSLRYQDNIAAQHALDEGLALLRETDETWRIAMALLMQGYLAGNQGDFVLARALFEESLALLRNAHDTWTASLPIGGLGWVFYNLGDHTAGRSHLEEALAIQRSAGDKNQMVEPLESLGDIALLQGDYRHAAACFDERLAFARELGSQRDIAWALTDLGIATKYLGDQARAAALVNEALSLSREVGDMRLTAICLLGSAAVESLPMKSAKLLAASQSVFEASGKIIEPLYKAEYERIENVTRGALGEEAFATASAEGRAMTMEQAIAFALE